MTGLFGREYAVTYDDLYRDKDYQTECDLLERVFAQYGQGAVRRLLDLGCGTGGHSVLLAERGYDVVGVDRSSDMLDRARARHSSARFELGDIATVDLDAQFDAVLMLFAVLGYQIGNLELRSALATVRRHLQPGGLFFCDFWYGPAVLAERPSERVKVVETSDGQIIRAASGELDALHDVCTVRYHLWRIEAERVVSEVREQHRVRYFFAPELELVLAGAGLELLRLASFPSFEDQPTERTWNVALVARAV